MSEAFPSVVGMSQATVPLPHPVLRCVGEIERALDAAADAPTALLTVEEKRAALLAVTRQQARLEALRLRVLAVSSDVAEECGARSASDWLAQVAQLDPAGARRLGRLAASLERHSAVAAAPGRRRAGRRAGRGDRALSRRAAARRRDRDPRPGRARARGSGCGARPAAAPDPRPAHPRGGGARGRRRARATPARARRAPRVGPGAHHHLSAGQRTEPRRDGAARPGAGPVADPAACPHLAAARPPRLPARRRASPRSRVGGAVALPPAAGARLLRDGRAVVPRGAAASTAGPRSP